MEEDRTVWKWPKIRYVLKEEFKIAKNDVSEGKVGDLLIDSFTGSLAIAEFIILDTIEALEKGSDLIILGLNRLGQAILGLTRKN